MQHTISVFYVDMSIKLYQLCSISSTATFTTIREYKTEERVFLLAKVRPEKICF